MSDTKESWRLEGQYFESCNCELLCPCLLSHSQAQPTEGHCDVVLAFHITKGNFGKIDLSGLNAAQALSTPGAMAKGGGVMAAYIDSRGTEEQRAALEAIFTGQAGGPPGLMASMIATRLPTKAVPINYAMEGRVCTLSIPEITDVTVEGVTGARDNVVWLENVGHPFSRRLAAAKGIKSHYKDHALSFENSGRNGHFSAIKWSNG
jgi:hypothetical protein